MLSKEKKLNSIEHKEVLSLGTRNYSSFFTLYALKKPQELSKCSVVIPKKITKKAFQRNKNKRKVFDIIKNIYPHISPGYFFVLMARTDVQDLSHEDLYREVQGIFSQYLT